MEDLENILEVQLIAKTTKFNENKRPYIETIVTSEYFTDEHTRVLKARNMGFQTKRGLKKKKREMIRTSLLNYSKWLNSEKENWTVKLSQDTGRTGLEERDSCSLNELEL